MYAYHVSIPVPVTCVVLREQLNYCRHTYYIPNFKLPMNVTMTSLKNTPCIILDLIRPIPREFLVWHNGYLYVHTELSCTSSSMSNVESELCCRTRTVPLDPRLRGGREPSSKLPLILPGSLQSALYCLRRTANC